jgi:hypothetical protein
MQGRLKILGANHIDLASSNQNLGNNYMRLGKYDQAKYHYENVLILREKNLG